MAIYRRFRVQQKYVNGKPTEEYRLGVEIDSTDYNSLEECNRGSDCTELEYRWVDMESTDDYICEGTNKYKKQRKQQKCITEEAWTNVYPYEYQKGDLIEHDSVDCGYNPSVGYHIYGRTDGHGSINISPSKEYYSSADVVTITALPSTDYMFSCYNYGGNMTYGSVAYNSVLSLTMSHNWYVSAVFSYSISLYYLYTLINGEGSIIVTPSKYAYSQQENVNILAFPSANYMFENYEYGSTPAYGSTILKPDLNLTMSNNWYVKANFVYGTASSGSLYYSYNTGSESWYNWSQSTLTKADNNGTIAKIIIDYGGVVQTIPSSAFQSHGRLTKIVFPNCTYVNYRAFQSCYKLNSVNLPNCMSVGSAAFDMCIELTSVNLPNCSYVGGGAFYYCNTLTSVNLPNCSYVGGNAFADCYLLTSINLPICSYVSNGAFSTCSVLSYIDLPNCSYVGSSAFYSCNSLTSVNLPLCEYVGRSAFYSCNSLTSVNLQNCSYISEGAFSFCIALPSIDLPNCSYVGSYAFTDCYSLTSVNLQNCISLGSGAFSTCSALTSIYLPNCSYVDIHVFTDCYSLPSIDLPNCSYVGSGAFEQCQNLTYVNLPLCEYVGNSAFWDCSLLPSIDLPNCSYVGSYAFEFCWALSSIGLQNCTYVGSYGFYNCSSLSSINLPLCSYVGSSVFKSCYSLSLVHLPKVTYIGSNAFSSAPIETLYMEQITSVPLGGDPSINRSYIKSIFIPCSLLDSFVSHSIWSKYSSYFVCV